MSYAKSLKKSPFKTLSLSLGKMPDGSIWQTAFITQDGDAPSAFFDCPSNATAAERKGFLPLVKEALRRAQSLDELTDMLKPSAVDRPAARSVLVEPGIQAAAGDAMAKQSENPLKVELLKPPTSTPMPDVPSFKTGEEYEQWAAAAGDAMAKQQQTSVKVELLYLLMKQEYPVASIEAVLNSGLLPDDLLQQWLNQLVERAPEGAVGAVQAAADRAMLIPGAAGRTWAVRAAWAAADRSTGLSNERKAQYDDLLNLINAL